MTPQELIAQLHATHDRDVDTHMHELMAATPA